MIERLKLLFLLLFVTCFIFVISSNVVVGEDSVDNQNNPETQLIKDIAEELGIDGESLEEINMELIKAAMECQLELLEGKLELFKERLNPLKKLIDLIDDWILSFPEESQEEMEERNRLGIIILSIIKETEEIPDVTF